MKYIDAEKIQELPGRRLKAGDTFAFRCHPAVACFNRCCRNLNLFLYPYDIVRLKQALNLTAEDFLERYTDIVLRDGSHFPEVLLRMSADAGKTCPFLTPEGCAVYPDRPDACRTFPVEQGVLFNPEKKKTVPVYFFRPPDFCLGQYEKRKLTTFKN